MKVTILENSIILKTSPEITLPDFTLLTGINGSGKTQFLYAIADQMYASVLGDDGSPLRSTQFVPQGFTVQKDNNTAQQIHENIVREWNSIRRALPLLEAYSHLEELASNHHQQINELLTHIAAIDGRAGGRVDNQPHFSGEQLNAAFELMKLTGKKAIDINQQDYLIFYKIGFTGIFGWVLPLIFTQYSLKKAVYPALVKDIEAPWDLFNRLSERAGFPYDVDYKDVYATNQQLAPVRFVHRDRKFVVDVYNLSSGEQSLLSLIVTLYNTGALAASTDILCLDEPDAFLHPTLADNFLTAVQQILVIEKGIKVVMTTHSPSTVALTPPESIFVMDTELGYPTISGRNDAIRSLTNGITTFNIALNDRKQIFTEADTDSEFYQSICERLADNNFIRKDYILTFIPCGLSKAKFESGSLASKFDSDGLDLEKTEEKGGCDRVRALTSDLYLDGDGNRQIFGLLDWDLENAQEGRIVVFGGQTRYAIENFIYDPLFIYVHGLLYADAKNKRDYSVSATDSMNDVLNFSNERFQLIVNEICAAVKSVIEFKQTDAKSEELIKIQLLSGHEIEMPKWYLQTGGHQIESAVRKKFPALKRFQNTKEFVKNIVANWYRLLPIQVRDTFLLLQNMPL